MVSSNYSPVVKEYATLARWPTSVAAVQMFLTDGIARQRIVR